LLKSLFFLLLPYIQKKLKGVTMYLNFFLVVEMAVKNVFNRKFTLKPISCLTNHLFHDELISLEHLFTLDPNARVLNANNDVDIRAKFNYSGYDVSFHFSTKKSLPRFLKKSALLTFFMDKKLSIHKNGVELYSDGFVSPEYQEHAQNIQNLLWFVKEDIKAKKDSRYIEDKIEMSDKYNPNLF
tara:strand:+ start:39892 stop:40443 length:552 start_codon:yes stop_codon:yes gene_type:complete